MAQLVIGAHMVFTCTDLVQLNFGLFGKHIDATVKTTSNYRSIGPMKTGVLSQLQGYLILV